MYPNGCIWIRNLVWRLKLCCVVAIFFFFMFHIGLIFSSLMWVWSLLVWTVLDLDVQEALSIGSCIKKGVSRFHPCFIPLRLIRLTKHYCQPSASVILLVLLFFNNLLFSQAEFVPCTSKSAFIFTILITPKLQFWSKWVSQASQPHPREYYVYFW